MSGTAEPLGLPSPVGFYGQTGDAAIPPGAPLGLTPFELAGPTARVLEEARRTLESRTGMPVPMDEGEAFGMALGGEREIEPLVQPDALNQQYGIPGHLNFSTPLPATVARMMNDAKRDELLREANATLQPGGVLPAIERFGIGVANTFLDPLELAANAVPIVGEARLAGMFARAGLEGLPLTLATRAAAGGLSGAAAQVPLAGLRYGLSTAEQQDYGMMDAAGEILMGAAGGALLHPLLGLGRPLETAEARAVAENPELNEALSRTSVAAVLDDRPVEANAILDAAVRRWRDENPEEWSSMVAGLRPPPRFTEPEIDAAMQRWRAENPAEWDRIVGEIRNPGLTEAEPAIRAANEAAPEAAKLAADPLALPAPESMATAERFAYGAEATPEGGGGGKKPAGETKAAETSTEAEQPRPLRPEVAAAMTKDELAEHAAVEQAHAEATRIGQAFAAAAQCLIGV